MARTGRARSVLSWTEICGIARAAISAISGGDRGWGTRECQAEGGGVMRRNEGDKDGKPHDDRNHPPQQAAASVRVIGRLSVHRLLDPPQDG